MSQPSRIRGRIEAFARSGSIAQAEARSPSFSPNQVRGSSSGAARVGSSIFSVFAYLQRDSPRRESVRGGVGTSSRMAGRLARMAADLTMLTG